MNNFSEVFKELIKPYKLDPNRIVQTGEDFMKVIVDNECYSLEAFGIFEALKRRKND